MLLKDAIIRFDKSSIKAGDGKEKGKYPLYTCSPIINKFLDDYIIDDEAIVVSTGGNFSIHYVNGKFNYSTDCLVFNSAKFRSKYLFYYLLSKKHIINNMFRGAGLKHLNKQEFMDLNIKEISMKKQDEIIKILDMISDSINNRENQINDLNKLIKSQFAEMFGSKQDGFKYNAVEFNTCVSDMLKGPFGSDIKKSLYVPKTDSTYKVYIQINALQNDQTLGDYYISKEYFDNKMYKFELKPLDYIVTCDGTLGKLLRLDEEMEKGIISASLLKITLNNKINYKYFEEIWSQYMLGELGKDIRNACLNHLPSAKVIGMLQIPLPPLKLQNKFAKIVEQVDNQIIDCKKDVEDLEKLLEVMLYKFFIEV